MEVADSNSTSQPQELPELDSLWNPSDLPGSEVKYRALVPASQGQSERERYYMIELLTWIARTESLQKKFPESHASLERAEKLLMVEEQEDAGCPPALKIRWLMERGRLFVLERTPAQARALFSDAWTLANGSGEASLAIEVAQLMADSEPQKTQQEWIMRAIKIAEGSPAAKAKRWLGSLYSTLGWKLYDLRQYEKSLALFQKALAGFRVQGTPREAFVARWSIGKVLRTLGKTEEALEIQKGLVSELDLEGQRDGRLYEELAECLHTLKRVPEAQTYFELAYRELSSDEWLVDNQPVKLKRLKDLGKVK